MRSLIKSKRMVTIFAFILIGFICCFSFWEVDGFDLRLRYNEIHLLHKGLDSYDVWTGDIELPCYKSLREMKEGDYNGYVHAYTPWHNICTWWYGWFNFSTVRLVMLLFYSIIVAFLGVKLRKRNSGIITMGIGSVVLFLSLIMPLKSCFNVMNYGILSAFALFLLISSLECKNEAMASICVMVLMFKPQVGIPFCVALLALRYFKVVFYAGGICVILTCIQALILNKSPLGLILRIPNLAASSIATSTGVADYVRQLLMLVICAWGTMKIQRFDDWRIKFIPAIATVPLWTYCQIHDCVVAWPLFSILTDICVGQRLRLTERFCWGIPFCVIGVVYMVCLWFGFNGVLPILHVSSMTFLIRAWKVLLMLVAAVVLIKIVAFKKYNSYFSMEFHI